MFEHLKEMWCFYNEKNTTLMISQTLEKLVLHDAEAVSIINFGQWAVTL